MLSLNQQRKEIEKSIQGMLKGVKKKYGKNKTENYVKIKSNIEIIKINVNRLSFLVNRICQIGLKVHLYILFRKTIKYDTSKIKISNKCLK